MTKRFGHFALSFSITTVLGLLLTAPSWAQNLPKVVVNVPFPFVVADRTLPQGRYTFSNIAEASLRIFSATHGGVMVLSDSVQGRAHEGVAKVVFHRYNDTYFLYEVWFAANDIGSQVVRSRAERELAEHTDLQIAVLRIVR